MAILKLWEEGKIDIEKTVDTYLPGFPYSDITVRMLLNHRSGLNNYAYFMVDRQVQAYKVKGKRGRWIKKYRTIKLPVVVKPGLVSNQDMLDFMVRHFQVFDVQDSNDLARRLNLDPANEKDPQIYARDDIKVCVVMPDAL